MRTKVIVRTGDLFMGQEILLEVECDDTNTRETIRYAIKQWKEFSDDMRKNSIIPWWDNGVRR